ncbi:MAG: arginine--tRNA ligase [Nitrospirae bacterium GWF2_44_13]|nr:MAG: arginine--tRNA ligase [Nitrospirae bacterium GWF2_44_13]OGW64258.1 MAG: arginine--tRNA ligase [Nitrospirae bacterium RIFOXYA2_FULL_44_9]HBG92477.1 arginine--tRNA ligase [Nitrospiraceae bacterium]
MKKKLHDIIESAVKQLGLAVPEIAIELPKEESFGDLATPAAMSLSKILKKPPRKIAEDIVNAIAEKDVFEKIDIAGPGFINFTFSRQYIYSELKSLIKDSSGFLRADIGKGRRIQIEFVSANPTGPLHLGHGRGAAVGSALSNLLSAAGYKVEKEFYVNDAGRQVKLLGLSVFARYNQLLGIDYPSPEDGYKGFYIEDIANKAIKNYGNKYAEASIEEAGEFFTDFSYRLMLEGIKQDLKEFGITFDTWQSERELYERGEVMQSINDLKERDYIYEEDGAVWFRSTVFGDDKDRVVIKKDGEYTYFAPDIAYHRNKVEKEFDELIDIWGADHHGYIPRIQAVIQALGYPKERLKVLLVQMVSLLRGGRPVQMSKRAGEFVTLKEVIDEVGADTTKFIFLTRRPDSHLEFDLEVAKAQSAENPVFYVQYANARINSIFSHAKEQGINVEKPDEADLSLLSLPEEIRIIKKLLAYQMAFEGAVIAHEPHRITFYLQELAGMFHPYYHRHKVVTDDANLTKARLALCEAVRIVLKDGFEILGLSAPERM